MGEAGEDGKKDCAPARLIRLSPLVERDISHVAPIVHQEVAELRVGAGVDSEEARRRENQVRLLTSRRQLFNQREDVAIARYRTRPLEVGR